MMAYAPSGQETAGPSPALPQRAERDGFTLVEVIAAIVILTVGVLGLAGTTAYVVRQVTLANVTTERSVVLQTAIEQVQSMPFANVSFGTDSVGHFSVQWRSSLESPVSKVVTFVTRGPGLHSSSVNPFPTMSADVADTFVYRVISR